MVLLRRGIVVVFKVFDYLKPEPQNGGLVHDVARSEGLITDSSSAGLMRVNFTIDLATAVCTCHLADDYYGRWRKMPEPTLQLPLPHIGKSSFYKL